MNLPPDGTIVRITRDIPEYGLKAGALVTSRGDVQDGPGRKLRVEFTGREEDAMGNVRTSVSRRGMLCGDEFCE